MADVRALLALLVAGCGVSPASASCPDAGCSAAAVAPLHAPYQDVDVSCLCSLPPHRLECPVRCASDDAREMLTHLCALIDLFNAQNPPNPMRPEAALLEARARIQINALATTAWDYAVVLKDSYHLPRPCDGGTD